MNDLKLNGRNDYDLDRLIATVKTFSDDIGIAFALDKCAKAKCIRWKLINVQKKVIEFNMEK